MPAIPANTLNSRTPTSTTLTLGLISDTHMGDRQRALPPALEDVFSGVDLILHAGDVGELWTLDALSAIAPVIAVQGNDELSGAPDVLPTQQVIHAAGQRILLYHGHYPDRAEELAARRIDDWPPKLDRWAGLAHAVGASILVYGHTHIGWTVQHDGVWLINPGAIAGGNHYTRQLVPSVARLTLMDSEPPHVEYVNLAAPDQPVPPVDPAAGFMAAFQHTGEWIITSEVYAERAWLGENVFDITPDGFRNALRPLMYSVIDGEREIITLSDVVGALLAAPDIPASVKDAVRARWPA